MKLLSIQLKFGADGLTIAYPKSSEGDLQVNRKPKGGGIEVGDWIVNPEFPWLAEVMTSGAVALLPSVAQDHSTGNHHKAASHIAGGYDDDYSANPTPSGVIARAAKAFGRPDFKSFTVGSSSVSELIYDPNLANAVMPKGYWMLGRERRDALLAMEGAGEMHRVFTEIDVLRESGASRDPHKLLFEHGMDAVFVELGGYDTHGAGDDTYARNSRQIEEVVGPFWRSLTEEQRGETIVWIWTEFGRTNWTNAAGGTEHGHGGMWLVAGAGVAGGILGEFPGMTGRDLEPTTDGRGVVSEIVATLFGVTYLQAAGLQLTRDAFERPRVYEVDLGDPSEPPPSMPDDPETPGVPMEPTPPPVRTGVVEAPENLRLGKVEVGKSTSGALYLTNGGDVPVTMTDVKLYGGGAPLFATHYLGKGLVIEAGVTHEAGMHFTPEAVGYQSTDVVMSFADGVGDVAVRVHGEGIAAAGEFAPVPPPTDTTPPAPDPISDPGPEQGQPSDDDVNAFVRVLRWLLSLLTGWLKVLLPFSVMLAACETDGVAPGGTSVRIDTLYTDSVGVAEALVRARPDTVRVPRAIVRDTTIIYEEVPGPERIVRVEVPGPVRIDSVLFCPEPDQLVVDGSGPVDRPSPPPVLDDPTPEPDTTDVGTLDFGGELRVGVVFGREVNDHFSKADRVHLRPAMRKLVKAGVPMRVYYLMGADFVAERDVSSGVHQIPPVEYDPSLPWGVYSNAARMRALYDAGVRNPLISTEAFRPGNAWTWKYFDTGDWIGPWLRRFVAINNAIWGPGNYTWQIASEPWDARWPAYAEEMLEAYLSIPEDQRPRIAYAALPVSQGGGKVLADGYPTNGWWPGTLSEFVLPSWRPYVDVLTVHAYPLRYDSGKRALVWDEDKIQASIDEALVADRWRDQFMPQAKLRVTETGAPFRAPWSVDYYREAYRQWSAAGVEAFDIYSLVSIDGGEHFEEAYILDDETGVIHPALDALNSP